MQTLLTWRVNTRTSRGKHSGQHFAQSPPNLGHNVPVRMNYVDLRPTPLTTTTMLEPTVQLPEAP